MDKSVKGWTRAHSLWLSLPNRNQFHAASSVTTHLLKSQSILDDFKVVYLIRYDTDHPIPWQGIKDEIFWPKSAAVAIEYYASFLTPSLNVRSWSLQRYLSICKVGTRTLHGVPRGKGEIHAD